MTFSALGSRKSSKHSREPRVESMSNASSQDVPLVVKSRLALPPKHGEILVAATPSNSSQHSSNSPGIHGQQSEVQVQQRKDEQNQESGDTQLVDGQGQGQGAQYGSGQTLDDSFADGAAGQSLGGQSEGSTNPSSSYERILNLDPFAPAPEATQPTTQPTTQQTQIVDDVDQITGPAATGDIANVQDTGQPTISDVSSHLNSEGMADKMEKLTVQSAATSSTTSTRMSIAEMAGNPLRRARLRAMLQPVRLPPPIPEQQVSTAELKPFVRCLAHRLLFCRTLNHRTRSRRMVARLLLRMCHRHLLLSK